MKKSFLLLLGTAGFLLLAWAAALDAQSKWGAGRAGGSSWGSRSGTRSAAPSVQPHFGSGRRFGVFFHGFIEHRAGPAFRGVLRGKPPAAIGPLPECPPFRIAAVPQQPPALLVFRNGSIYEAVSVQVEGNCLHYRANYGGENTVPLAALDLEQTRQKNAARHISLDLP